MTKKAKKNNNKPAKPKAKAYNKMSRVEKYEHIMQLSTESIWTHMITRLEIIPDEAVVTKVSDEQERVIDDVEAVESEWILDDYTRRAVSLIQWTDNDDQLPN